MIDKLFKCPRCHQRYLRYWPEDRLSPEAASLAPPSAAQQDSQGDLEQLQGQGKYVCERCDASFAGSPFAFSKSYPFVAVPELEDKLKTLLNVMNEQQGFQFKQAVVKQAIHCIEEILPPEEEDEGHRFGIRLAKMWLDEPTGEKGNWVTAGAAGEIIDGRVRYYDYPQYFLHPAFAAGAENAWKASRFAVKAGMDAESDRVFGRWWHGGRREEAKLAEAIALYAALEWQIAAAQAILCNAELPPFELEHENGIS